MYNKTFVVFILVLPFLVFGLAQESQIRLETVYEKTFEDTIVDVVFDTATVSLEEAMKMGWKEEAFGEEERLLRKGVIFYPKVIITKDSNGKLLKFYNYEGKRKKVLKIKRHAEVTISQNSKYLGVTTPTKWHGGDHESKFEMIDANGNMLWEIEGLGTGPYVCSPDGKYAIGEASNQIESEPISIYSNDGMIKTFRKEFAGFWTGFAEDGSYIAVGIPLKYPRGKVVMMDDNMKTVFEDTTASIFGDVGGGEFIKFGGNKYVIYPKADGSLSLYTSIGDLIFRKPNLGMLNCVFSNDLKWLGVVSGYEDVYLINISKKELAWKFKRKGMKFRSISASENFDEILVVSWSNKIYLLDNKGNVRYEGEIPLNKTHWIPKVKLSRDGKKIAFIREKKKIEIYSFIEER